MSEVKVNKITPTTNCGTVTLGDSGDTLAIPCGVTLSNAGSITNSGTITNTGTISGGTITGTIDNQVNWDTTAKTAGFTAVAGNGYFINTTSGAITVTLPATPTAGDLVGIKDYANTANTNNITIDRNGSNIQGTANNFTISVAGTSIILIYVDGTQGWVSTGASKASDITEQALFITATGGTITTCGDYKIHTFTGPGTFCVSVTGNGPTVPTGGPSNVDYLVVAGGGAGYSGAATGGGGAGGYRTSFPTCGGALPVSATAYPITVGGGGPAGSVPVSPVPAPTVGTVGKGSDSVFSTITSTGGGPGGSNYFSCVFGAGQPGGSGGGGGQIGPSEPARPAGGSGNTPPVSPPQGNNGGQGALGPQVSGFYQAGGGGGGAGGVGSDSIPQGGNGGAGSANSISGSPVTYAGGGAGGICATGGSGGGGNSGVSGTTNTGGGGGGANVYDSAGQGGSGGSGIVIIRYKYQ